MNKNYSSLVGVPYDKMNCWDLCRSFYSLVFNIELKHYFEAIPETKEEMQGLIFSNVGDFSKVEKPSFGDLIIFSIRGIESHIGIYIDAGLFFHSSKTTGSVHDRIDRWKNLVVGYYRHRGYSND